MWRLKLQRWRRARSAVTGQFVTEAEAKKHPKTTMMERAYAWVKKVTRVKGR